MVGLIGGMSWQTTSLFYEAINKHVGPKLGGILSANLLIRSVDYADIGKMVTTRDFDGMIRMLSKCGQELKNGGAQSLAVCANVAHKAADTPKKGFREQADRLIFDELSKQPVSQEVKTTFEDAYASLLRDHQVDCVVLACTELRLVFNADKLNVPAFETTTLHAKGIAEWALQKE
jgi:aspartate/glutamate racemase